MSAVRSIWLLGVPSIVIAAGIYLFRKRNDPGGSKEPEIEEKNFSDIKVEINTVAEKSIDLIITPDPLDNTIKSAPINIPVGSPIQLTDDQIDLEIKKIQSQKSQEKEYTMSSSVIQSSGFISCSETQHNYLINKRIRNEVEITANDEHKLQPTEASPTVQHKLNGLSTEMIQSTQISFENTYPLKSNSLKKNELPTELSNRLKVSPKLQESIEVASKIVHSNNAIDENVDALLKNRNVLNNNLDSLENSDASNDNLNSFKSSDVSKDNLDSLQNDSNSNSLSNSLGLKVDWPSDITDLEFDVNNTLKYESRPDDSAYHSPVEDMGHSPQLSNFSDDQPRVNWSTQKSESGSEVRKEQIDDSNNVADKNLDAIMENCDVLKINFDSLENADVLRDNLEALKDSDASNNNLNSDVSKDNLDSLENDSTKELVEVTSTETVNPNSNSLSNSLGLKIDWSSDITDLEFDVNTTHKHETRPEDSAYHSPVQNMGNSPPLSNFSDDQPRINWSTQKSESGSEPFDSGTESTSANILYYFALPKDLVGRLIGKGGKFVKSIKTRTGAIVLVRGEYSNGDLDICSIEGKTAAVDNALSLIRNHFPKIQFSDVSLEKVNLVEPAIIVEPEYYTVQLPHGVTRCTISSVVDGGRGLFCLQMYSPSSFIWLESMKKSAAKLYNKIEIAPTLPDPITPGNICVCKVKNEWRRAVVLEMESKEIAFVRLLDIGQRLLINKNHLFQIRTEYMQLPFQAIDCYLANTKLPNDAIVWPEEATEILRVAINQNELYFNLEGHTEDGVSLINLYSRQTGNVYTHFNEEFVSRGFLEWAESNC